MATDNTFIKRCASLRLIAEITHQHQDTDFYYYQRLLYSNNCHSFKPEDPFHDTEQNDAHNAPLKAKHNKYADLNGGFFYYNDRKRWADYLHISETTFRIRMASMVKNGYFIKKHTGWQIVSMERIAAKYGIELKSLKIRGYTKETLKLNTIIQNIQAVIARQDKATDKKRNTLRGQLSLRTITAMNGNKSAMTAWKRVKKLEALKRIVIPENKPVKVCKVNELKQGIVAHYIIKDDCYYQPANRYIIIENAD